MQKARLNFIVDAMAFAAFVFLTATGILIHWVLPPGSGRFSALWGMDRHEWGEIHFWIAVILMASLGLHLFLHWRSIVSIVKGRPHAESGIRAALAIVGVIALVGLSAAPFFGRVAKISEPLHRMRSTEPAWNESYPIDGSTTLAEVERITGIPATVILQDLGLPSDIPKDERLGRLRKEHEFELNDLREIVRKRVEEKRAGTDMHTLRGPRDGTDIRLPAPPSDAQLKGKTGEASPGGKPGKTKEDGK